MTKFVYLAAVIAALIPSGIGFDLCDWCTVLKLQRFSGKYESKPIPLGITSFLGSANIGTATAGGSY